MPTNEEGDVAIVLTLHQGNARGDIRVGAPDGSGQQAALLEAADSEETSVAERTSVDWAAPLRRFANALPERGMVA